MPKPTPDLWWVEELLEIIPFRKSVNVALAEVGISKQRLNLHINRSPEFRKKYYERKSVQQQKLANILGVAKRVKDNERAEKSIAAREREETQFKEFKEAMDEAGGNVLLASKACSFSRMTIYRRVERDPMWRDVFMRYR